MRTDGIFADYGSGQSTVIHCSYKAAASSSLGRCAENKPRNGPNVAMQQFPQLYPNRRCTAPSKDLEILRDLFPAGCEDVPGSDIMPRSIHWIRTLWERRRPQITIFNQYATSHGVIKLSGSTFCVAAKKPFMPACQWESP